MRTDDSESAAPLARLIYVGADALSGSPQNFDQSFCKKLRAGLLHCTLLAEKLSRGGGGRVGVWGGRVRKPSTPGPCATSPCLGAEARALPFPLRARG